MFYLTTHLTHFIYGYIGSDIWLRTILIVRNETHCHHIGYSFWLTARVLLYAPSHRQDRTYHSLCYTSRGTLAGTRNSSVGSSYEGSIRRPIAPWANALTTELHLAPTHSRCQILLYFYTAIIKYMNITMIYANPERSCGSAIHVNDGRCQVDVDNHKTVEALELCCISRVIN